MRIQAGPVLQRLYDWRLTIPRNTADHIKLRVAERLLRVARALGDPLVSYPVAGFPLRFPLSHRQPWTMRAYPEHSQNLGRIATHLTRHYPELAAIDIGANVGDTVAILRRAGTFPILAVEGTRDYFDILQLNAATLADVELAHAFIGASSGTVRGDVVRREGTAAIRTGVRATDSVAIHALADVLQDHPRFTRAKLLKVDTDGYDGWILRGARTFLEAARPVVFFEYEPLRLAEQDDDGVSLFPYLASLGYDDVMLYDDLGVFMFACSVGDARTLTQIHRYLDSPGRGHYCDLCVFPREDHALCVQIQQHEMAYFASRAKP